MRVGRAHTPNDRPTHPVDVDDVRAALRRDGYFAAQIAPQGSAADTFLLDLARSLGELYVPVDCDPEAPLIRTAPTARRRAPPFDRAEAIGWHGDFATYPDRPEVSLVYIARPDPRGGHYGAWRLASVNRLLGRLAATADGRAALDFLGSTPLPFLYAEGEVPRRFLTIESRPDGHSGMRFYLPSIRQGCVAVDGEVPQRVADALAQVGRAADEVARTIPTLEGSLLVTSNWFALHDRVRQTISRTRASREALLCFVSRLHGG